MSEFRRTMDQLERVLTNAPREVERVARLFRNGHTAVREVADALEPAVRLYRDTHGGQDPGGVRYTEVPDESYGPLVELGSLCAVAYVTSKEPPPERNQSRWFKSLRPDVWIHDFETPYPGLAFRVNRRELVIVRDRSRYTIGREGIDG